MRLIDAEELIEMIEGTDELLDFQKDECIACVDACDTVYDIEKVIAKLEEKINVINNEIDSNNFWSAIGMRAGYEDAIEIVKKGGIGNE